MKTSRSEEKHKTQWTARVQQDDLDFADDLTFLSHTQEQMQEMISVTEASKAVTISSSSSSSSSSSEEEEEKEEKQPTI
ncbi:unnamed protein product [Schistosoma margrebowiei]|uniref:Uncharacterized protein n=1 Tax=Schistosoma margrebowiei TaxID=48269 RepID=A0A183ME36_9TREM|nr:unnamed protein product [Schistosoma margrebowiei]